ncbi:hypothetical protein PA7_44450 [Pseudonocardia asaccharolytica DSM 44247 = NBRC 16224]|uniref:Uncharacterized protein n=1 Tax=Pseudonocardia asaccharolytica DSM 44247 = NBRC 16224 TaxID=1123024 RepID=A0A511DCD0_9PSEU|nr:hypothetical protein PA7_44450 [Pseudonocardia asaccharolytica DSM 44247 = NBRC 16224]
MGLFRFWGIADAVRAEAVACDPLVAVTRTLAEEPAELVPFNHPSMREALPVSPAFPAVCAQDRIEPLLVQQVRGLGGEVRFATPLIGLRVTADGARRPRRGRARPRPVRRRRRRPAQHRAAALGIGWEHLATIGEFVQVLFRPDLAALLGRRPPGRVFVTHPDAEGVLLPVGAGR